MRAIPWVHGTAQKYAGQGLGVITVHPVDRRDRDETAEVRDAARQLGVREPVYLDAGFRVQRGLKARVYPTFALIDRKGNVRFRHSGALGLRGGSSLEAEIERLLAER